jgi:hypothetical protein
MRAFGRAFRGAAVDAVATSASQAFRSADEAAAAPAGGHEAPSESTGPDET